MKTTAIQHILEYIANRVVFDNVSTLSVAITTHNIEFELPNELVSQKIFINPGTLSRKFRLIREHAGDYGLSFTLIGKEKENTWKVSVTDMSKLQQALSPTAAGAST